MLNYLKITNFKCFPEKDFNLKKLNVFSGYNGRGKSSILQTILLLHQSIIENDDLSKLRTQGKLVDLGSYLDLLNNDRDETISLTLKFDKSINDNAEAKNHVVELHYTFSTDDEFAANISSFSLDGQEQLVKFGSLGDTPMAGRNSDILSPSPEWLNRSLKSIYYISANRQGPVKYVEAHGVPRDFNVGSKGEDTINIISSYRGEIDSVFSRLTNAKPFTSLTEAASWWLNYIMDNATGSINIPEIGSNEPQRKSAIRSVEFGNGKTTYKAINVGFGYSYILSVVVMALIAPKNSILIIENPEAHLHPKAQSRLTELLCLLTERDIQVMIETHSEHIVNGTILRALEDDISISTDDINIYFFDNDFSVTKIEMDETGKITNWPDGFFDQAETDNAAILRLGMKKMIGK